MNLDFKEAKAGTVVEIKSGTRKGMWKVVRKQHVKGYEMEWYRLTVTKDTSKVGGEIILECFPDDAQNVYVFEAFNSFAEGVQPLPPPPSFSVVDGGKMYDTLDKNPENNGFEAMMDGKKALHWEYEAADGEAMQIYVVEKWVEMFLGIKINVSQVEMF